ncbi:protein phosphatase CheZ [Thiomicrorhabdus cannonii]|uniref:protein phosphatase CheZ n=1 Tax=Thiomicrorhabdus cannonii TaxID=2748011 RepID=UPI0015C0CC51|nr:protein phosphatase CheZ [Thiomicrorhabdus cannonii]
MKQIDKQIVLTLLDAVEQEDQGRVADLLDELTRIRETQIYQQLEALTKNLHETLDDLEVDAPILLHAKHDLPDIAERLQYVIHETQAASGKTLQAAENLSELLEELTLADDVSLEAAKQLKQQMNSELTNIMLAQSFQDLTGQVLNRVILIVTALEESLKNLIERSKHDFEKIPERRYSEEEQKAQESKGMGPNVTRDSKQGALDSQEDIDDLLSDLGI